MKLSLKVLKYINEYGLKHGFEMYMANKYKRDAHLKYSFLKHPVNIRSQVTNSDMIMFRQIFETHDYNIHVPFEPRVILDMGANVGFASIYFANRFPNAKIFALEPNAENYAAACKNVKPYANVTMVHGAIWNSTETIHLVDKGFGEASFMVAAGSGEGAIQAFTIDTVLQQINEPAADIVKIDIEGAEKEIFEKGYENWLPKTKIVIVETHDRYRKGTSKTVFNTINKYDFSLEVSGENLVFYNNELVNPY
jgi:FkbM family methyltransferase